MGRLDRVALLAADVVRRPVDRGDRPGGRAIRRYLFFDARLYLEATRAWLDGGDPWDVQLAGNYFAAPPPSLLPLAPIAMLPLDVGVAILASLVIVGAVATVRLLDLPWWWILFPPLVQCVLSATSTALLVPADPASRAARSRPLLKVYAGRAAGHPRPLAGRAAAGVVVLATIPILPWATYLADLAAITAAWPIRPKYHAAAVVLLVLPRRLVLAAAVVVGRDRAAWLVVAGAVAVAAVLLRNPGDARPDVDRGCDRRAAGPGSGLVRARRPGDRGVAPGCRPVLPAAIVPQPGRTIGAVTSRTGLVDSAS